MKIDENHRRIKEMHKSQHFIVIGWDSQSKKSFNYLSCIEGKGGGKDIQDNAQNAALFLDQF